MFFGVARVVVLKHTLKVSRLFKKGETYKTLNQFEKKTVGFKFWLKFA